MSDDRWEYEVRHNSTVDLIARAMEFYRVSSNFLEVIRFGVNEYQIEEAEKAIKLLQDMAIEVARKETR